MEARSMYKTEQEGASWQGVGVSWLRSLVFLVFLVLAGVPCADLRPTMMRSRR